MAELDLTAAIEAATVALWGPVPGAKGGMFDARIVADVAVRAAEPLLTQAALEWLAQKAAACRDCGRVHEEREREPSQRWLGTTWADPDDGHPYRRHVGGPVEDWIRARMAERTDADGGS